MKGRGGREGGQMERKKERNGRRDEGMKGCRGREAVLSSRCTKSFRQEGTEAQGAEGVLTS